MNSTFFLVVSLMANLSFASVDHSIFSVSIGKPAKQAKLIITWGSDEITSIEIKSSDKKYLQKLELPTDWTNLGTSDNDRKRKNIVRSADANFDNFPDILIESSNGTAGQSFQLFLYDPKLKKFIAFNSPFEIWNPSFDRKKKLIVAGPSDMPKKKYSWKGNSLVEL